VSLVLVGLSYRSAPVELLERVSVGTADSAAEGFLAAVADRPHVAEAVLLSTCNRVEIYADVMAFHTGVAELTALLASVAGLPADELSPHIYVHYEDRAVQHLFHVVCGLDSMVVGEAQILGQVRDALRASQRAKVNGRTLSELFQQALRVGKRAHAETGIDRGGSLFVDTGLGVASRALRGADLAVAHGEASPDDLAGLAGRRVVVIGAGSMSALALATLTRLGAAELVVANRGAERAGRVATRHAAKKIALTELGPEIARTDLVVCCTGATAPVLTEALVRDALARRSSTDRAEHPLVLLDLALPRDVEADVGGLPGVTLVGLEDLGRLLEDGGHTAQVEAVRSIATEEVSAYLVQRQAARVAPTVVALRALADDVVAAEMVRFDSKTPGLDAGTRSEAERMVRRVVDKLLHLPTVRVKEFAAEPSGLAYAEALRALFDLEVDRYRETVVADLHAVEIDLGGEM